jgi:Virulence factor BrkB
MRMSTPLFQRACSGSRQKQERCLVSAEYRPAVLRSSAPMAEPDVTLSIYEGFIQRGPMLWTVAKEAASNWSRHRDSRQGATLAYYSVISLSPIIVIAIAVAGFFFGREAVNGQVASSITGMLGETGAKAVQAMLAAAGRPWGRLARHPAWNCHTAFCRD